jgi:tetrahydromethanopterin S-methyltransferase subunit H
MGDELWTLDALFERHYGGSMGGFGFDTQQKVCDIAGVTIGGQPGANPTVLIASMFHKGDGLIEDRKAGEFDREGARKFIERLDDISRKTSIPAMIDIVGNSADEIEGYLEFVAAETSAPICIDSWQPNVRIEAARRAARLELLDRLVYNSLNPWNPELEAEVEEIAAAGVRHVVVAVFDDEDKLASGRIKSLEKLMPTIEKGGFESILVDTTVMNVAAMAFSIQACRDIKERFGFAVGCAPSNGTYMWKELRQLGGGVFSGADASAHGIASLLWNDFLFYGPMTGTERVFGAVATAESIKTMLGYAESGEIIASPDHPARTLFGAFLEEIES